MKWYDFKTHIPEEGEKCIVQCFFTTWDLSSERLSYYIIATWFRQMFVENMTIGHGSDVLKWAYLVEPKNDRE